MSVGLQMFLVALLSFVGGMISMELIARKAERKAGQYTPEIPPPQPWPKPTPPPLEEMREGEIPKKKTSDISTGAAVSTVKLFERQNEMEKRLDFLEHMTGFRLK